MSPQIPPEPPDQDLGTPADVLLGMEDAPSPRFLMGVRNKIDRRRTANQLVSFSWNMPGQILLEMLGWISQILESFGSGKGSRK